MSLTGYQKPGLLYTPIILGGGRMDHNRNQVPAARHMETPIIMFCTPPIAFFSDHPFSSSVVIDPSDSFFLSLQRSSIKSISHTGLAFTVAK